MKNFNLIPNDSHKSFYGKARVTEFDNGSAILTSYETVVCSVDTSGNFHRHWGGYSATTMRHVNAFLALYGIEGGGKAWWIEQETTRFSWVNAYFTRPAVA